MTGSRPSVGHPTALISLSISNWLLLSGRPVCLSFCLSQLAAAAASKSLLWLTAAPDGQVVLTWRAAKGARIITVVYVLLAHAKVGYLDVPIAVQKHIVELQVAIHDGLRVQVEETDGYFGRIEAGHWLLEAPVLLDLVHQVAPVDVLHDEEQPVDCLETRVHLHQEGRPLRVLQGQHALLDEGALDAVVLNNHVLFEYLNGEHLPAVLFLGQQDLCVSRAWDEAPEAGRIAGS